MQTSLSDAFKNTAIGQEADAILRSCVHCGFCTATCPTYQIQGDELDGPRGRIYLIKQVLEGQPATAKTQLHLDRCLTCRSCESTCPSGVQYGHLVDIGRAVVEQQVGRTWREKLLRRVLRSVIPHRHRFTTLLKLGRLFRPLLPAAMQHKIPQAQSAGAWPTARHARKMLVLQGCAQPATTPLTNASAARVLDKLGVSLLEISGAGCCGALSQHLSAEEEAKAFARRNIDAWWPHIAAGAETIVMTASGCGVMVKDYGHVLRHDPDYAGKAQQVSAMTRDLIEVLLQEDLTALPLHTSGAVAAHAPCTLQHGQKLPGALEQLLRRAGFELTTVPDAHLCCGSAGTYSILQPDLSQQLLQQKLIALSSGQPTQIVTANVGCQLHLASKSALPVRHWIELFDQPAHS
ncbi:glycolate oxidase subunit GlcF [Sulfuriferula thiophila]|uniref:glycolate oxidase subunit GlcF n=1 Tax=Sulfuriferula thiophila TaxID=1781211 RepID=UPI000F61147D|nr:glycolate oxidase subunit GlcF [Sulfuriferula thiophila]